MKRVFIAAYPVGHSLSPAMHNAAFAHLGVEARYSPAAVAPSDLPAFVTGLREPDVLGANFSVPHKEAVYELVDELTPTAAALGAVNTVVNRGGRLIGDNTDGGGYVVGLLDWAPELAAGGFDALVLGAGGAARAVVRSLLELGADVTVVNRDLARAERLAADLRLSSTGTGSIDVLEEAPANLGCQLLINTTSVGMVGGPAPLALPLVTSAQLARLPAGARVSDLVYRPAITPLLAAAQELGLQTQNGVAMLVGQGALAFTLWTGLRAPTAVMRSAVENGLSGA